MKAKTQVLLFITEEDLENARRAKTLRAGLERAGWSCRVVNRLSNDLDELRLAARYRAVHVPRWVIEVSGKVWRDELVMPSFNEASRVLAKLETTK